jgi:sugar phosphate isomerase/epimerase
MVNGPQGYRIPLDGAPFTHYIGWMNDSLSRRQVIHGVALAAVAALFEDTVPHPIIAQTVAAPLPAIGESVDSPVRLGIASYTFRKFDGPHLIDFMHQLKTPYLHLRDVHLPVAPLEDVPAHAAAYRAAGLTITGVGNVNLTKDDDADIRAKFEYCKAAGVTLMACAASHAALPRLERFVREYDIRLALHNNGLTNKEFPAPSDVLKAVTPLDPRVGCCLDVGAAMRAGADPVASIRAAGPRLYQVHMKDVADHTPTSADVAVGDGVMPVRAIFAALAEMKYAGYVDLEYEIQPDDPMPGVAQSFAFMHGVLAGLGYR